MSEKRKPHVVIGSIGHVDHNKTSISQAIQKIIDSKPQTINTKDFKIELKKYENQPIFENTDELEK